MLHPKYRYIGIDFETTGLDTTKDVPIQLWIVEIDHQGNIIDSFESLIKPDKDIKELKNIVQFITKIDPAQLVFAPTLEELLPQIQHFFWENVIIIGHTIHFDVAFLQKFFPTLSYHAVLDTFQLSQALIPYPQSYALEILIQHLEDKPLFLERKSKFWLQFSEPTKNFHDALYDATSTMALFCYLIAYLHHLQTEYPVLGQLHQKSDALLSQLLPPPPALGKWIGVIALPPLKKIAPKDTSLTTFPYPIAIKNLTNLQRYYVGNLPFKSLLASLLANKKMILVFASKPKLDIAKNTLFEMGIKNIGFAREEQTISPELFSRFLNKSTFTQPELYFLIKYCSHLSLGYGVLDLNSKGDYMVYNFIKDERQVIKYPLVLTTHHGLYSILEKEAHAYAEFDIVFFDVEWRYKNYNAYLSRTCDLYYVQNFVEMLIYKYESLTKTCIFEKNEYTESAKEVAPTASRNQSAPWDASFLKKDESWRTYLEQENWTIIYSNAKRCDLFTNTTDFWLTTSQIYFDNLYNIIFKGEKSGEIGKVTIEWKNIPIVLDQISFKHTFEKHWPFSLHNFLANINNPDYKIIHVRVQERATNTIKEVKNKINLFKVLPGEHKFLVIGANLKNWYYVATHFEVVDTTGHKLVDYVSRGIPLDEKTKLFLAHHTLQQFDTFFAMFIGILRTETKKLFINRPEDDLQINPIVNNLSFYQTNLLLPKLRAFESPLQAILQPADFQILRKQITHFLNICDTVAKVQRKLRSQSDFYFLFSEETKFTNRDEFTDMFAHNHIVFFSHHETSYPKLIEKEEKAEKALAHCTSLSSLESRLQELTSTSEVSIFIISTIKEESRAIFEYLQKLPFLAAYELLVENITGGAGKNIFKANKKVAKIIVGGYNFLMMCYAQRVKLDDTIIRNIKGTQSKLILDDILRYDPT